MLIDTLHTQLRLLRVRQILSFRWLLPLQKPDQFSRRHLQRRDLVCIPGCGGWCHDPSRQAARTEPTLQNTVGLGCRASSGNRVLLPVL